MWRRVVRLVAINAIVFGVLAEVMALAVYFWDTGRLFYANRPVYAAITETQRGELTADALHPYFGPIHRPGVRAETNNVGFGSPQAFPFARTSADQFLVGIFGGSVARYFCDLGMPRFTETLRRNPAIARRTIVPLCFSHEGYKQPQQALVLAYFLSIGQEFDLVVNIDGFNEVALGTYNHDRGHDVSMPSPLHLDPLINLVDRSTLTPEMVESLAAIERDKRRLNALAARINGNRLASVNFVLERYFAVTRSRYIEAMGRLARLPSNPSKSSLILVTPALKSRDASSLYGDIAANWAAGSRLMHDMLAARGVPYVHVLQPNQYFTKRRFGAEEARVAINAETPFKRSVEAGYPALVAAAQQFSPSLRFVNGLDVFNDEPSAVYQDDCCHYTQRGNELLAEFIANRILLFVNVLPRPASSGPPFVTN